MDDEYIPTPEEEAEIKRSIQDCNDGLTYLMLTDEDGNLTWDLQCEKCKRVGNFFKDRPFPHKLNCPMARS